MNTHPIVETVKDIYSTGTNEYQRVWFEHFIVYLEGYAEPFRMSKKMVKDIDYIPRVGDKITCFMEEGRLKNVKILFEHNPNE